MKLIIEINEIAYKNATHIPSIDWNGNLLRIVNDALQNGTPLEQMIAEIESAAEYQDTYVNADIAIGMYKALEYVRKCKGE